jgi:hypothetical protein
VSATALTLLAAVSALAIPLWGDLPNVPKMRLRAGVVFGAAVVSLGAAAVLAGRAGPVGGVRVELTLVLTVLTSVVAGGPVSAAMLRFADHSRAAGAPSPADPTVLHGGAWIGALERLAVTASLLAGWPEGIAIALAVKGLGRYPELRAPSAAERFIIGTFASVLWAGAAAGVGLELLS